MAIYKGQLMNQETKDILYPQTSTDMVDGLEELLEQGVMVADTLPIGSVIGWDSEEDYPTDIYEEVDYNPIQSIINNSFQINQREQSSYVQNKDELKLTVDCWIMASSSWEKTILTPLKDGVRIQSITLDEGGASYSNSFTQILENEPEGDKTIIINVTNLTGHAKFGVLDKKDSGVILDKKELVKGINVFHFNISEEKNLIVRYFIDKNTDISIEYTDLFEGNIAYPHVKEDYQEALLRCQRKIIRLKSMIFGKISGVTFIGGFLFPVELDSLPNVVLNSIKESSTERPLEGYDAIGYNTQGVNYVDVAQQQTTQSFVTLDITFSCEPL